MVAAVGMNGTYPMVYVFGIGSTKAHAEADALQRMAEADVELVNGEPPALAFLELTDAQAEALIKERG